MTKTHWFIGALAIALLIPAHMARAQGHSQFDQHDRQVANDWYNQHKNNPPSGLRPGDRLTPAQEARLRSGETLDSELQHKSHSAPRDLRRKLPPPPPHHAYQMIGGHLVLVDTRDHKVRDVIHLHP